MSFKYEARYLRHAKVAFNPPVSAQLAGTPTLQVLIYKLEYDEIGALTNWEIKPASPDTPAADRSAITAIGNHLRFEDESKALFLGCPWKKWAGATQIDANGNPVGPGPAEIVEEITFRNEGEAAPRLTCSAQRRCYAEHLAQKLASRRFALYRAIRQDPVCDDRPLTRRQFI